MVLKPILNFLSKENQYICYSLNVIASIIS